MTHLSNIFVVYSDYIQIDPPLGIESWELVDIFESAKVEAAIKKYIGEPEGKLQIDAIAALLVVPAKKEDPSKPEEITPPKEEGCLPANPDCDKPRPTTEEDWLKCAVSHFILCALCCSANVIPLVLEGDTKSSLSWTTRRL